MSIATTCGAACDGKHAADELHNVAIFLEVVDNAIDKVGYPYVVGALKAALLSGSDVNAITKALS